MKRGLFLLFVALVAATYQVTEEDICCLPPDVGPCKETALSRWYYNVENGACERFIYGGYGGNENNFLNKCLCQKQCGDDKDICCQSKEVGPCRAAIPRWYYNSTYEECHQFTYGGCEGNQNNFEKKSQCEQKCS